ncbi:alpha/beta fold hydrolase [Bradyrhizobium liaoningense]|nr:alpha/beta fold hydrolase [Bradyrhizobium liaoningense]
MQKSGSGSVELTHKRVKTNGVTLHYVTAGRGPVVLCMHGWPQNHREFHPVIERLSDRFSFIAPDLRGYGDSDKPYEGYEPKTIAEDMIGLLKAENVTRFHILSHDLDHHLWRWRIWPRTGPCRSQRLKPRFSDLAFRATWIRACLIGTSVCT